MSDWADFLFYLLNIVVLPLVFSIGLYLWLIKLANKQSVWKVFLFAPLISGISFLVLRFLIGIVISLRDVIQYKVSFFEDLVDICDFIFYWGTRTSLEYVNHQLLNIEGRNVFAIGAWWKQEIFYFLFYVFLGIITTFGARLLKSKLVYKILGIILILASFFLYMYIVFIWMYVALQL